ncbi:hypothetical protein L7F22_008079 [Adiantum nelumboides]|nr:hypothetical protein [Adiantum nelumboides]
MRMAAQQKWASGLEQSEGLLLTNLSMDNPSTLLSMDSGLSKDEPEFSRPMSMCRPPDINLPFTVDNPASWLNDASDILNVGLACQGYDIDTVSVQKRGKKVGRRGEVIWGACFFFNHYFRPLLTEKGKAKYSREVSSPSILLEKTDLMLDRFLVQHDMENMYMWAFKERPQNALGKMQLRSYMNGHTKQGEPQFPFSADKGFARSHKMQRKQYKGLSNPQCIHGIELVPCPNLSNVSDEDKNRWVELMGRDINFSISTDAEVFITWRTLPNVDSDAERTGDKDTSNHTKKLLPKRSLGKLSGAMLNLSRKSPSFEGTNAISERNKRKEVSPVSSEECSLRSLDMESPGPSAEQPQWLAGFSGVMTDPCGPVTAAKTIYEDEKGYLIMVSLPFTDIHRVRVSWLNTATHGIVRLHCISTARTQYIRKGDRTFELTDPCPEHCPPGEFIREITLATRIPDTAELQAFYVEAGAGLEITVPKHLDTYEEREVRVFLPPQLEHCDSLHS